MYQVKVRMAFDGELWGSSRLLTLLFYGVGVGLLRYHQVN